jgi:hypothetical protein
MANFRSAAAAGILVLLMTSPALAFIGEGRDHGPGYQWVKKGGGWDKGRQGHNGNHYGWSGGGGNNGKHYDWSGGGKNGSGHGWSRSAPGPVMGIGLPGLAAYCFYAWYRRRQRR